MTLFNNKVWDFEKLNDQKDQNYDTRTSGGNQFRTTLNSTYKSFDLFSSSPGEPSRSQFVNQDLFEVITLKLLGKIIPYLFINDWCRFCKRYILIVWEIHHYFEQCRNSIYVDKKGKLDQIKVLGICLLCLHT